MLTFDIANDGHDTRANIERTNFNDKQKCIETECPRKDRNNLNALPQPPYSHDLSLCNFLFPKLKLQTKSNHFETVDNVQKTEMLRGAFQKLTSDPATEGKTR